MDAIIVDSQTLHGKSMKEGLFWKKIPLLLNGGFSMKKYLSYQIEKWRLLRYAWELSIWALLGTLVEFISEIAI